MIFRLVSAFTLVLSVCFAAPGHASDDVPLELSFVTIPMSDGVELSAIVVEPRVRGPHPVVVVPAAWATTARTFVVPAIELAREGFVVVSYTSRGFHDSGGEIDVAGVRTVADVSEVIDWAVANTAADPERIGAMGVSYGAGASLLAAARDPRIDAVAALSAWGDLAESVLPNDTVSQAALEVLYGTAQSTGNPGAELENASAALYAGDLDVAQAFSDSRSPSGEVVAINANGTAVFIANAWVDSLFPPNQIIDLFDSLFGEKKIVLLPGDHATAEAPGALGIPTASWDGALEWMVAYVRDETTLDGPRIELVSNDPDREIIVGDSFEALATMQTIAMKDPRGSRGRIRMHGSSTLASWRHEIFGGVDTIAESGPVLITGAVQGYTGRAPRIALSRVDRDHALVWESEPLFHEMIVGSPTVKITVDSTSTYTTLVFYLYEKPVLGRATLISHKPYTIRGLSPGVAADVRVELEASAWALEPGSRVVLVVDTVDGRYRSETEPGSVIGLSSTGGGALVTLPLR